MLDCLSPVSGLYYAISHYLYYGKVVGHDTLINRDALKSFIASSGFNFSMKISNNPIIDVMTLFGIFSSLLGAQQKLHKNTRDLLPLLIKGYMPVFTPDTGEVESKFEDVYTVALKIESLLCRDKILTEDIESIAKKFPQKLEDMIKEFKNSSVTDLPYKSNSDFDRALGNLLLKHGKELENLFKVVCKKSDPQPTVTGKEIACLALKKVKDNPEDFLSDPDSIKVLFFCTFYYVKMGEIKLSYKEIESICNLIKKLEKVIDEEHLTNCYGARESSELMNKKPSTSCDSVVAQDLIKNEQYPLI